MKFSKIFTFKVLVPFSTTSNTFLKPFLFIVLIFQISFVNASVPAPPTFGNPGPVTICVNGSYYLNPSTTNGTFSSLDPTIATINSSGYVTGVSEGTTIVSLDNGGGTVTATVTVTANANPSLTILDPLAQSSYKFNNNPQGPVGGIINYVGYNGFTYSSQARPINTGFFRASKQLGNNAGCPNEYYIFRCTTCGTVPEYATRPQGTLTGNTILKGSTGKLTYTSSNGGGPFTISYIPSGGSNVTVNNISSTVAFNVASGTGTPITTTTYNLISVTDENTNATTDFSGTSATITVNLPHYIGESYGGGIVFYITDGGAHGLIAATSDQSNGIVWGPNYTITGATETAIGTGLSNTLKIINIQGGTPSSYAAGLARAYTDGLFNDWYLPSLDELNLMYSNIGNGASGSNKNIGNFTLSDNYYWSSTEYYLGGSFLYVQDFTSGTQTAWVFKTHTYRVRAIRSF